MQIFINCWFWIQFEMEMKLGFFARHVSEEDISLSLFSRSCFTKRLLFFKNKSITVTKNLVFVCRQKKFQWHYSVCSTPKVLFEIHGVKPCELIALWPHKSFWFSRWKSLFSLFDVVLVFPVYDLVFPAFSFLCKFCFFFPSSHFNESPYVVFMPKFLKLL